MSGPAHDGLVGLIERNEAITRLCMAIEPAEDDLAIAGDRERWLLYRSMVRFRLEDICRRAFKRGLVALGEERFIGLVAAWLEAEGPRTPYFWRVPLEMIAFTLQHSDVAASESADVLELLRYEAALWRTRHQPCAVASDVVELDFERPIVLNPTIEQLDLEHPVHEGERPFMNETTHLLLYRRPEDEETITWTLSPFAAALVRRCGDHRDEPLKESIRQVATLRKSAIDAGLIESLGELLARFLENGIVLGGRATAASEESA